MLSDESLAIAFPAYRRYAIRVVSQSAAALAMLLGCVAVGVASTTTWLTGATLVTVVGICLALAWHRWRGGSTSLSRRGLPPGERTSLACPLLDVDHHQRFADRYGPVFTTNHLHTPLVAVHGLVRGQAVLRGGRHELSPMPRLDTFLVEGGFVRVLEGDEHRRMRSVLSPLFAASVLDRLRPTVEEIVDVGLDGWGDDAAMTVRPAPLIDDIVLDVLLTLFFGPSDEPDQPIRLRDLYRQIDHLAPTPEMRDVQDRIVDEVRALARRSDLPDCVLRELITRSPESLDDLATIENLVHLVTSSHADMCGLFEWIVKHLADHPSWAERLRRSAVDSPDTDAFVSETLRLSQSEMLLRYTTRPTEIGGYTIPARWMVRVLVRESHRDPAVFDDPLAFRPERFISHRPGRFEYSPFGLDGRSCIGETLTRVVSAIFLDRLADRFDLETVDDGPLQLSEHRHAAPFRHWTVELRRVGHSAPVTS